MPAPTNLPVAPPSTMVIFGAHGDLTRRLLVPALANLAEEGLLDERFRVLGVDHNERSDEAWRSELDESTHRFAPARAEAWNWLRPRFGYFTADFEDADAYARLAETVQGAAVFYEAVSPRFFEPIVANLARAGMLREEGDAFRRVVIEKPFGTDLASARALNRKLLEVMDESQIYRIDYYLGKETVQNILALRFGNGIFEPLWRREYIDHVQITAAETVGVETRGKFYETTGALRDMVPNHLFQLLAMTTMEPPASFRADAVRAEKAKVLSAVPPVRPRHVVRGQYASGSVGGEPARGYREESNVARDSRTETYVALKVFIDNWRWAGVPFYLRTGKRLAARRTEIAVQFRQAPTSLFRDTPVEELTPNVLRLHIQPREGLTLAISAKHPGPVMRLAGVDMRFRYEDAFHQTPSTGYETLLYDCLTGDQTLFQRADNVEAAWAALDPVLRECDNTIPHPYFAGGSGPEQAEGLLANDGRRWLPLT